MSVASADPPGKRAATKAANRAAILAAAQEVFAELGYGAATVRDIVRGTDLATGTFYNYFPDKESIFRALLDESASEARALARAARQEASTLEEFVTGGYRAFFEFLASDQQSFELMRRNAGTIRTMFDEPVLWAGSEELADDLRAGIAAGAIPDCDVDYMAAAMVGAAIEIGVRMVERDPVDVDAAVRFATDLFLGGLERMR